MEIEIEIGSFKLFRELNLLDKSQGIVIFVHGSGSSRHSTRNKFVAKKLEEKQLSTLLFDLLTLEEETVDERTKEFRFNIPFLANRLLGVTDWVKKHHPIRIGYFGASTGAAAALVAASQREVEAVVSRGERPDLAGHSLIAVKAATLFILGSLDSLVLELNKEAFSHLNCQKKLEIVDGATQLFEEEGTLEIAAQLAANWFPKYLTASS